MVRASEFRNVVVLTGAGVSSQSGIPTYRDPQGLWKRFPLEELATPEAFEQDPRRVWHFYSLRKSAAAKANPNPAHQVLARYAAAHSGKFSLITQNVDGLHEKASRNMRAAQPLAMHGSLSQSRCTGCQQTFHDPYSYYDEEGRPCRKAIPEWERPEETEPALLRGPECTFEGIPVSPCCRKTLRPNVVWFGEKPFHLDAIQEAVVTCELFVCIGTSGSVYPAAGLILLARASGARTVCLNRESIPQRMEIDEFIAGEASDLVPQVFQA